MPAAIEDKEVEALVANEPKVFFLHEPGKRSELGLVEHTAGRVMWRVDEDGARFWR
jgi:hypothetical protein